MARNRDRDRANLGEQTDLSSTDVERQDRSMSAGARSDSMAGSEGIEDPVMERSRREPMETSTSERSGRASSRDMARVKRGKQQQGRERTDEASSFSGQGRQKEASESTEGNGYVGKSNTEQSEPESR